MSAGNTIKAMPMITVDTSTLNDATYTDVTSGGLPFAVPFIRFTNSNTRDILLSFDGVTEHDVVWGGAANYSIQIQQLSTPANYVAALPKGQRIFLKLTSMPGVGNLYIVGYYQK